MQTNSLVTNSVVNNAPYINQDFNLRPDMGLSDLSCVVPEMPPLSFVIPAQMLASALEKH
jgi:hypothetical protein